ncbi:MAG: VOC family protein [Chloroflexota bacterium]|nr:VOC family protein [Chloroflexota bacterium]
MVQHGEFTYVEIPSDDPERTQRFYQGVFGWQFRPMEGYPDYFVFETPAGREGVNGAVGRRGTAVGQQTRNYVQVDSIDQTVPRIEQLGGSLVQAKAEVPGQGWFAVVRDPEGNEFALWEQMTGAAAG